MQVREVQVRRGQVRDGGANEREPRAAKERNFRKVERSVAGIRKGDGLYPVNHMIVRNSKVTNQGKHFVLLHLHQQALSLNANRDVVVQQYSARLQRVVHRLDYVCFGEQQAVALEDLRVDIERNRFVVARNDKGRERLFC